MDNIKEHLKAQMHYLQSVNSNIVDVEETTASIIIHTSIHFDHVHITVNKQNACAGWTVRNSAKHDYILSFKITPISDTQLSIDAYSYGVVANCILHGEYVDGTLIWKYDNYNDTDSSFNSASYPYIDFTESVNKRNQFTEFIAHTINIIKDCLNNELYDYEDITTYDNEPSNSTKELKEDLILTIRDDTWNILRKKGCIKLPNNQLLQIDKSMIGKKIVRKDSDPNVFYPLHEEDFQQYHKSEISAFI